jgi:3-oxoacyl-[acyl-carrier-protein] synthase III
MVKGSQRFSKVVISSIAHLDGPHVVTSDEIESQLAEAQARLGIQPNLLQNLAGIQERRFWDVGVQPSAVAAEAGAMALERSRLKPEDIGVLINTSVCRDYIEPSVACIVHHKLGLSSSALNFDLGNACLGFLNGMAIVAGMIERGEVDHGLVVDGEGSRYIAEVTIERLRRPEATAKDFRDQFASLTLGSGSAAMVLSREGLTDSNHRFKGGLSRAATEHNALCVGQREEMRTNTKGLLNAGLELAGNTWKIACDEFGFGSGVTTHVIHQISSVHTNMLCATLGVDMDTVPQIFPHFGNTGPASIPMVLSKEVEKRILKPGDRIALAGMGSGLNCSAYEIVW